MIVRALNRALVERHDNGGVPAVTLAALEREAALLAFARTGLTRRDERLRRATGASSPAVGRSRPTLRKIMSSMAGPARRSSR